MKRIVITGMGAVTPVGIGVDEYWRNITAGVNRSVYAVRLYRGG